ncbi:MAG: tetratricopeptide repeat protein [Candidatus Eutrophobiaceae bacterium]
MKMGRGVPQDDETAAQWYLRAAEQGDAVPNSNLGVMWRQRAGRSQNDKMAVQVMARAEQGHAAPTTIWEDVYRWSAPQDDETARSGIMPPPSRGRWFTQFGSDGR